MIGIFGGTFDPIHNAHISIADLALKHCQLEHIYFVPCYLPVHRPQAEASANDRLNMVKLAINQHPKFSADDREIERDSPSYMVDTLKSFQCEYPSKQFALIVGYDAWEHFKRWHQWEEILNDFHIIIISRPHFRLAHPELIDQYALTVLSDSKETISATEIREAIASGEEKSHILLPKPVYEYIIEKGLYA